MIAKQEIMDFAREFSLPVNTIEKDYVLGWFSLILKGEGYITKRFDKQGRNRN
jgi:hypothetical protein